MPIYEYQSDDGEIIEKIYRMKDPHPEEIVENDKVYKRVFSVPMMTVVDSKAPKTLGALAEKNTQKMIKEGKLAPPKKKKVPWWRQGQDKPNMKLANLSEKEKTRYIEGS